MLEQSPLLQFKEVFVENTKKILLTVTASPDGLISLAEVDVCVPRKFLGVLRFQRNGYGALKLSPLVALKRQLGDLTPCDFYLWGYIKDCVYKPPLPRCLQELKFRIREAAESIRGEVLQTVWAEMDYRIDMCRVARGSHIEQL